MASFWKLAFLGLGANLPTRRSPDQTIAAACSLLNHASGMRVTAVSSLYRSKPWGELNQPDFYNAVAKIETALSPLELLHVVKAVEQELGRTPTYRWGPRVIDIDILLYDLMSVNEHDLIIPHQHLLDRPFAYVPLLEVASDAMMPDRRRLMALVPNQPPEFFGLENLGELRWQ